MGEYGMEVWGAYSAAFLLIAGVCWLSRRELRKVQAQLREISR